MSRTASHGFREQTAFLVMAAVIAPLVAWRTIWISATPTNGNHLADNVSALLRSEFEAADEFRILFPDTTVDQLSELTRTVSREHWDSGASVWLIAGDDLAPGWKGWDDNVDGAIDDAGELGASWSDDRCVTDPDEVPQPVQATTSRVMGVGAYRPAVEGSSDQRIRINVVYSAPELRDE